MERGKVWPSHYDPKAGVPPCARRPFTAFPVSVLLPFLPAQASIQSRFGPSDQCLEVTFLTEKIRFSLGNKNKILCCAVAVADTMKSL